VGDLTELFNVKELTRQPVRELSLGERMKMELIAALLHQPQLLLLDEPPSDWTSSRRLPSSAPEGVQHQARRDHAPDQPLHARRGGTLRAGTRYQPRQGYLRRRPHGHHEQFGRSKLVKLQFAGETTPPDLERFGEVTSREDRPPT